MAKGEHSSSSVHDPAIVTGVLAAVESALNHALSLAPGAALELQELADTVLAVECTSPAVEVFIRVEKNGESTASLHLSNYTEHKVSTRVRGSLEDFIALASAEDPAATLINSDLEIVGNTAPLLAIQQIITRMDLDWEAPLVDVLGDVVGHQLAQLLRGTFSWGREAGKSLRRQLSEFILEEGRLSPPAAELEHFYGEVEKLTLRVERLQSRLQRLARKVDGAS